MSKDHIIRGHEGIEGGPDPAPEPEAVSPSTDYYFALGDLKGWLDQASMLCTAAGCGYAEDFYLKFVTVTVPQGRELPDRFKDMAQIERPARV